MDAPRGSPRMGIDMRVMFVAANMPAHSVWQEAAGRANPLLLPQEEAVNTQRRPQFDG